ncbi:DUF3265 domain-containing protein, partial [Vibrio cholerae]|nr:DUF3265 domain-containing protein [Vibrio cholerae]EGR0547302.1 DUF3265 domain-containing protein [Vibrio cholerae]EGR0571127.1 DUF3265 domain-containing protein [Vibrio cholerae]EGR0574979.1 DUF3265 domain-containing protein [Vibrio cholerae]EGR5460742.1 DUF3265 domain-containing protein [Vibrio cholerae]
MRNRIDQQATYNKCLTNASRGTANAWHFYNALVFSGYGVMRKLGSSVGCPL